MPTSHSSSLALRVLKWLAVLVLLPPLAFALWIAVFGWNWARAPLENLVSERTGRALRIAGDLGVKLAWPAPRIEAAGVTFANPPWASEPQMLAVDKVDFTLDLSALWHRTLVFPEVLLTRPVVFLEQAPDGRKTWLLDRRQSNEDARIPIGRLRLDQGVLGYDEPGRKIHLRADVSTRDAANGEVRSAGVVFAVRGTYKGLPLAAQGSGGPVLALHDESAPYPLTIAASVGNTSVKADGSVTSLVKFSAIDMQLGLRGESLAQLFPLIGIALPETHAYSIAGHLLHRGQMWRYEKFSGKTGTSDIAGSVQIDRGAERPFVQAELVSQQLTLADLGPLIGARLEGSAKAQKKDPRPAPAAIAGPHVLPDMAFRTERWNSLDADVSLRAKTIRREADLPLEDLVARVRMKDALLSIDPLDFGVAHGELKGRVSLDGRHDPIVAQAKMAVRHLQLARLFPKLDRANTNVGQFNGEIDLTGKGNSVGRMLATADGKLGVILVKGEVSRLMMEEVGLHLLEILQLKLVGDRPIRLNCAVAAFDVKDGVMQTRGLLLDTEVNTVTGHGSIDLGKERLDLTLEPKTRTTSPVALRSPIYVRGTFAKPEVAINKGRVAAQGAGAVALGLINPLLALIPLVEMGPGLQSECGRTVQAARAPAAK